MSNTTTILAELMKYMKEKKLGVSDLARACNMNPGTISGFVNGNRKLSVYQLDRITETMGHPIGYYYEHYISEYLADADPNWRRMSPFLESCAKLNKLDCIQQVVNMLLDKLGYANPLFELAEKLFEDGLYEAAAILYENVALSENKQHSERLALCQYRLFQSRQGDNQEKNYEAAVQFGTYVDRLDELDQLDGLKALANTYRSLRKWDKVELFAKALGEKAEIQYKLSKQQHRAKKENSKQPSFPLFAYWAFSHLLRMQACGERRDYEQAFYHIKKYANLSWVTDTDEETLKWKKNYEDWAVVNMYVNKLLSGDRNVLPDYVAYISSRKDEVLPALDNILEAANRYHFDVDDILKQFEADISSYLEQQKVESFYTQRFITERFIHFSKELSAYYLTKGKFTDGFKFLFSCLEKSTLINNKSYIIKCMSLFESYHDYASSDTKKAYKNIINEVNKDEV
ncbi:helix-turn-helix domain-containing protein [Paenibacillus sp. 23TSA30-6]|uniref:helix-turn-helix domain-containing protein n=1 Tax=Paenibacillus sp. 23TSA30-6 TaxID=2546104 RepID=UPI00178841A3|nr:helix-turn-helix transcriptional regulator [Paenibacillus sp. 23TSA30-6]MBE0338074.1 XRE family transcriptional regulator [Paenibacillus sp. 23TSA30-6]